MGKLLTILTPTYNRGEYLENIFVSLQQQTDKDFEWVDN
ncbi:glycosyltransferase family A protein [Ligilactobacillus salivarius]|nr:glycosyltransferase family A protein [Ligilactobacillus salivarius]